VVNVLGGLAMGMIAELGAQSLQMSHETRAFLTTGILGGFTTFSAFSLDAALLIERGELLNASAYVLASVIGSVGALFAGLFLVRLAST
jgi:CrcB protein